MAGEVISMKELDEEVKEQLAKAKLKELEKERPLLYQIISVEEFPEYMRWHDEVKVLEVFMKWGEIKYSMSGYVRKVPRY